MNGQWIGSYSGGTNTGILVADLDPVGAGYEGALFIYDNNSAAPRTFAQVKIPKDKTTFSLQIGLSHAERGSGSPGIPLCGAHDPLCP